MSTAWFDEYGTLTRELPADCIDDCSKRGQSADAAVAFWVEILSFQVPRKPAIRWLRDFGAWNGTELASTTDNELAQRVLWLLCCAIREYPNQTIGLHN